LILLREEKARALNISRQHFLRDDEIEKIVTKNKISPKIDEKTRQQIIDILNSGLEIDNSQPFLKNNNLADKVIFSKAKDFINAKASELGVKGQVLLTNFDLKSIINNQNNFDKKVQGWRLEVFGKELKDIVIV